MANGESPGPLSPPDRSQRFQATAATFARISLAFLPVLIVLRAYEYAVVRNAHVLPAGAGSLMLRGLRSDLALTLWLAAVLAVPVIALAQWLPRVAHQLHRAALVLAALAGLALVQYFAITFAPLGADLFGYSWREIHEITMSAKGSGVRALLPFVALASLTWYLSGLSARARIPRAIVGAFYAALIAALVFPGALTLKPQDFRSDAAYFLADNKSVYFADRTIGYLAARWSPTKSMEPLTGYPLLHAASYEDVLGPYLNIGAQKPNLVFVIVEGLGRDFAGEGAYYGGFTPFLDSLANRSLYWENFLSTSGRTFGMVPSLLGSLPYAEEGFMGLGAHMPGHISLVSLLKERGYSTSYLTGTYGHFDNVDIFMERQGVDLFVDQSKFGPGYEKQPADEGGFSWGYPDRDLFRRSLEIIGPAATHPRLDVYKTTTSHEPFIPPSTATYQAEFERRLALLPVSPDRRDEYRKYEGIFSTLLYIDDALRYFLQEYAKREDFGNTIFFITGDHRLIPIPTRTRIDRFHVPLWIFSKMLKAPRRFSSVSSHLDITPSVLALLQHNYGMSFPDRVSWLGTAIDTAQRFRNVHSLALMRTKNELEYLDGMNFLSGEQVFRLEDGFGLHAVQDSRLHSELRGKLEHFEQVNRFVTSGDHLYPGGAVDSAGARAAAQEDSLFLALGLRGKTPAEAFDVARRMASRGDYDQARLIARKLLRDAPNYHDARTLLGRTYAWQRRFDEARPIFADVVRRAPEYLDGRLASVDLEIWAGRGQRALTLADAALAQFPLNGALLLDKARALELLGRKHEALTVLDALRKVDPTNAAAAEVRSRLSR